MVKTIGSKDKVFQRKQRSDFGKQRKKYSGKPCKHRKPNYYSRRIGNKDSIKIWAWQKIRMSKDGYKNWRPHLRPLIYKEIADWKSTKPIIVQTREINTKKKLENFIADNYWAGNDGKPQKFVIMGISNAKTKTHRKWVKICTILVSETPNGNVGKIIESVRLHRYSWFYKE